MKNLILFLVFVMFSIIIQSCTNSELLDVQATPFAEEQTSQKGDTKNAPGIYINYMDVNYCSGVNVNMTIYLCESLQPPSSSFLKVTYCDPNGNLVNVGTAYSPSDPYEYILSSNTPPAFTSLNVRFLVSYLSGGTNNAFCTSSDNSCDEVYVAQIVSGGHSGQSGGPPCDDLPQDDDDGE